MAEKKERGAAKAPKSTLGRQLASQLARSRRITANLNTALALPTQPKKS